MKTTIISHEDCLDHNPGGSHPESKGRLEAILRGLKYASFAEQLKYVPAPLCTEAQILLAHSQHHIDFLRQSSPVTGQVALDGDTIMSSGSLNAALRGVGASCFGIDQLMDKSSETVFCATRPPGHHCTFDQAMGFCLFNNIAIAALYAQAQYQVEKIAIIDFDVHHGNGTEDIMRGKPGIFYISTHQSPLYPGTGQTKDNIDRNIFNIPIDAGTNDEDYQAIFSQQILPALNEFKPNLLLVSAGFDAHRTDPLAGLALSEQTYRWLGETLRQVAKQHCQGKLLAVLEGGYNLDVLGASVVSFIEGLRT